MDPPDVRAKAAQLILQMIISPVDQLRVIHDGLTLCPERCQRQCCAAAQIPGCDVRTGEVLHPADNRRPPGAKDPCDHAVQVARMAKPVLKYILHDHASSFRNGQQSQHLGLHIRRKTRMRLGLQHGEGREPLGRNQSDDVRLLMEDAAHLPQFGAHRMEILYRHIRELHFTAGDRPCAQERPRHNAIRHGRVGGAAQIKTMKKVAGTLKIDQAQYRELEAFAKFSSDMDAVTAMTIDRGRKNNQLLIQSQYSPMPVAEQVAILY